MIQPRHEEECTLEDGVRQASEGIQTVLNSQSNSVQSTQNEEPIDDKMYDEQILILITTIFFICLITIYWDDYTDQGFTIPTYSLNILVLLFKRDSYGLDNFLYTIIAVLNTIIVILLFLFLSQTSHVFADKFDLHSQFLQLRLVLYALYTFLMNIRIAKRANRIVTISNLLEMKKEFAIGRDMKVVQSVKAWDITRSPFIIEHLVNRVENYGGDSLYLFLIAIISFFSYQISPLEDGHTGYFVSVMLLVSTELVILAIYDLTIRNRELDAIEMRNDTNFAKDTPPARFCGLPVHWFRLLRTVKMQPLSLLLLFFGTLTIIFFALD